MTSLAEFQDGFAAALTSAEFAPASSVAALVAQPGFAVYRNTTTKGCIDALEANFPAVVSLTGAEWFRAAAREYVRDVPPTEPSLLVYGRSFPDFLVSFPPAAELAYLPDVARLDRAWTEAHIAADNAALCAGDLMGYEPDSLGRSVLVNHAAARWYWSEKAPAYSIWRANRAGDGSVNDLAWNGEGALLTRRTYVVEWIGISMAACRFLDGCAAGRPLAEAFDLALAADPETDLARLVATLAEAGAFTRIVGDATTPLRSIDYE